MFTIKSESVVQPYGTIILREISTLRAKSIRRQLDGSLSTRTDLQTETDKVDASYLQIKDMGIIEE